MKNEELIAVVIETNKKMSNPIDEKILKNILSVVILNPLDEDRGTSQEQIRYLISQEIEV